MDGGLIYTPFYFVTGDKDVSYILTQDALTRFSSLDPVQVEDRPIDMASITVRDARSEECEQILALLKELAVFEDDVAAMHADNEWLRKYGFGEDKRCHYLVAEDSSTNVEGKNKLVGVLVYTWVHKVTLRYTSMYIEDLYVTEGYRGRRVGRELLERAIRISQEQGYGDVQLITRHDNHDAIRFYKHYGAEDFTNLKG